MITFVNGMLVGMGAAVVIQIAIGHLQGKSFKRKKVAHKAEVILPELTAEEKWEKICKECEEDKDMDYINSVIDFCEGK